jgi:hypothetical protein
MLKIPTLRRNVAVQNVEKFDIRRSVALHSLTTAADIAAALAESGVPAMLA